MASFGPSLAGYTPGSGSGLSPEVWQQLASMYNNPATYRALLDMGSPEYTDPASGLNFVPKFKEIAGNQIFDGGTVYKIQGKGTYDTPGDVYDAGGKLTNPGFNIHHDKPNFMDNYGFLLPLAAPFAASAMGLGAAGGAVGGASGAVGAAGAGGVDLGGGLFMTADGAIIGGTGAFVPATAAEMGAMGVGAAGTAGASIGAAGSAGSALTSAAGGAGNAASALAPGGFDWTKLIGPGLSAIGGIAGANAASSAADAQLTATREAQAKLEPWYQAGGNALNRLQELLGIGGNKGAADYGSAGRDFTMADYQADPGLEFRRQQGEQGLQRAAAANGSLGSGKYLKDAMSFNSGLASQEYGNAFNRFQTSRTNKLNPLQSLAGQGQSTAQTIGDLSTQGGNAVAAGKVGQANAFGNALTQGFSMYSNSQQQDQNNALINMLLRR